MNRSTHLHPDVVPPMKNPKATLRASQDLSFETERNHAHEDIPVSAWEATLNEGRAPTPAGVATAVHDEGPVEFENHHIGNRRTNEEDGTTREVKSVV